MNDFPDCPECAQGKHQNCTIDVIRLSDDAMVTCGCYIRQHKEE